MEAVPSWPGPAEAARQAAAIRAWVTVGFRFELGAVLFGSSREVLRDMRGDCSEAAILAAALLRARGIPSRVALGFASAGRGVFVGHAWTEAWLGAEAGWVGVDAALGQFPAGVERLKLAQLDGRGDMRVAATNVMLSSLSNLDIEILEARRGGANLTLVAHPGAAEEGGRFFADILEGFGRGAQ
jgi:transglutaminase-like putative cysteine protease